MVRRGQIQGIPTQIAGNAAIENPASHGHQDKGRRLIVATRLAFSRSPVRLTARLERGTIVLSSTGGGPSLRLSAAVERKRRGAIEREEQLADLAEQYAADLEQEGTKEGKAAVMAAFAKARTKRRLEQIKAGDRPPGASVLLHQILWARWIEVAVENEMKARDAFSRALNKQPEALIEDFRASLVAISAAAHVIEAVFGEIKYRIPDQVHAAKRHLELRRAFTVAFGLNNQADGRLLRDLQWLFELRDLAVHPYAEAGLPKRHPAGYVTGAENGDFNAVTTRRAVDIAMSLLAFAQFPPKALNRAIERWAEKRQPYHVQVVDGLRVQRAASPLPPF